MQHVDLAPVPGFCFKTTAHDSKVFVNVAWDAHVPPPPAGSDDAIRCAMRGEASTHTSWFVPLVVSEPRAEPDKAGRPSQVFDCIFNPAVKDRILRDPDFKLFIIELALQRIEANTGITLSRHIRTPNIASKGHLAPRRAIISTTLLPPPHADHEKRLVEEISPPPKPILKKPWSPSTSTSTITSDSKRPRTGPRPQWTWDKRPDGLIELHFFIPGLACAQVKDTLLDVEPRRVILTAPQHPVLDIDLAPTDAQISAQVGRSIVAATKDAQHAPETKAQDASEEITRTLRLKRERDFNVDGAQATWVDAEAVLTLVV